jgi:acetyl-CoA carboxylase biotin carboxyl carrier protein
MLCFLQVVIGFTFHLKLQQPPKFINLRMDFKQIQELIKIVNRSNIGELSIEDGDFKIVIKQKEEPATIYANNTPAQSYLPLAPAVQPPFAANQPAAASISPNSPEAAVSGKQADHL